MKTPAVELLGHMIMEMEEASVKTEAEQHKTWITYLMMQYSKPSFGEEKADLQRSRQEFEKMIRPKKATKKAPAKQQNWEFELLDQLKAQQGGG